MHPAIFLAVILIILGIVFVLFGILSFRQNIKLNRDTFISLYAKISDISKEKSSFRSRSQSVYYFPILDFKWNGYDYSIKSSTGISVRKKHEIPDGNNFAIGDTVKIRIYENNVNTVIIESEHTLKTLKVFAILFTSLGLLLLSIGIALVIMI